MKVKVSELVGPALDWAVAKCEGFDNFKFWNGLANTLSPAGHVISHHYSSVWAQGGPIIEREKICPDFLLSGSCLAVSRTTEKQGYGPTPLIAAMRCYVASKMGDIIEVPDELL